MFRRASIVLLLALVPALVPASALAVNDTNATAQPMDAAHNTASDTLTGNSGGAYRYFAINYPGGGVPVPITMTAQPGFGTGGVATGFKVYGPTGFVGDAIVNDHSTTSSTYAFTIAHTIAGTYYVQVFNYIQGMPLSFQLSVGGLGAAPQPAAPTAAPASSAPAGEPIPAPPPPEAAPAPAPAAPAPAAPPPAPTAAAPDNTTPEGAIVLSQTTSTSGGTLPGKRDGNFNYFWLDYPGGNTNMTITLGYSPLALNSDQAVGFKVYRQDPSDPTKAQVAGESSETGRNSSSATEGFTLNQGAAERVLLQVFNYLDGITINYTLIVSGLAGPVVDAGDVSTPDKALTLAPNAQLAARGNFVGDKSGRFNYFLFPYPGGNKVVTVTVTSEANAQIGDGQFGFNLWDGTNRVGTAAGGVDQRGRRTASLTINQGDAKLFGIQVYNYTPGIDVHYTIAITGI
ncbi:MAG TPA: hypothetical protein VFC93_16375 [Chloroflexota bacterium]|nr:hypothetical protein [Chloroflexota bacterium]